MAAITRIEFFKFGKNQGCTCDNCGQYITNVWAVDYSDGLKLHFGIDCFANLKNASKLSGYGSKLFDKIIKRIKFYHEQLNDYKTGKITEENDTFGYLEDQINGGAWAGKPYSEYREWVINKLLPCRIEDAEKELKKFMV